MSEPALAKANALGLTLTATQGSHHVPDDQDYCSPLLLS